MALDPLLRKYFPVLVLVLLALSAYFEASGASELVGAAFIAPPSSASAGRLPARPPIVARSEPRSADAIIERNPFDSVTGPLNAKPVEVPSASASESAVAVVKDPLHADQCEGITPLIITESDDRLWSVAALQGAGEPRPRMRRVGDDVAGKKVEYIGFNPVENSPAVWLSGNGTLCQALLFKTAPPPAASAAPSASAEAAPPPRAGAPSVPSDIASKIQKISDSEFHVDHAVIDNILEHQADLMKSARIVPESKDGKVVGIRLFGIRPDTLLGTLGIQNGDRLESINGFDMGSPEKALEAYARLRTATSLNVKVNRRGAPLSIDYKIQ
ncbi:MAG TPA: type II secretion system protein GspC [Polyangiaceae bacterium]|nr:type II secretion system protein GspC [Polyangiaceae bacterium]